MLLPLVRELPLLPLLDHRIRLMVGNSGVR